MPASSIQRKSKPETSLLPVFIKLRFIVSPLYAGFPAREREHFLHQPVHPLNERAVSRCS